MVCGGSDSVFNAEHSVKLAAKSNHYFQWSGLVKCFHVGSSYVSSLQGRLGSILTTEWNKENWNLLHNGGPHIFSGHTRTKKKNTSHTNMAHGKVNIKNVCKSMTFPLSFRQIVVKVNNIQVVTCMWSRWTHTIHPQNIQTHALTFLESHPGLVSSLNEATGKPASRSRLFWLEESVISIFSPRVWNLYIYTQTTCLLLVKTQCVVSYRIIAYCGVTRMLISN